MIPKAVKRGINEYFATQDLLDFRITKEYPATGGDINEGALFYSSEGPFFVKWNDSTRYPLMFEAEFRGLQELAAANEIAVPKPLHTDEIRGTGFLLMEAVISEARASNFWFNFGSALANLHRHSADAFGLDHDNYIGSLRQYNRFCSSWPEFYITQRLEPQLKMARDRQLADSSLTHDFNRLFASMDRLFPAERPALLHGDLWSGNFMVNNLGRATLIDPAIYYGHREMDLAMTKLFGGFTDEFYAAYHLTYPLNPDWEERSGIAMLYPLLVHLNLFGISYLHQIKNHLKRFV